MSTSQLESADFDQLTLQFTKMTTPNILSPKSDTDQQPQQQHSIVSLNSGTSVEELLARQTLKQQQQQSGATNITESVPVPSSEHVAEIVGRQGSKIKALRAKTNTYIKTPIRGEAPMFVITGRREDVLIAKREIELAAEHFSQIRASRRIGGGGGSGICATSIETDNDPILSPKNIMIGGNCSSSSSASISPSPTSPKPAYHDSELTNMLIMPPSVLLNGGSSRGAVTGHHHAAPQLQPGHVSKKVTVPYQVVGLVVGPKGSTIKRIQQNTNTYIVTPSRDSQPVFEIQGLPDNVDQAKVEIENYIMMRTSSASTSSSSSSGAKSPKIQTSSSQKIPIQLCTNLQQTFNDYDDSLSSLIDNMNQVNLWSNLMTPSSNGAAASSSSSNSSSTSSSFSSSIFSEQFLNHHTQASTTNSQCNSDFGLESILSLSGLLSSNINNNNSSKLTSNILTPPESSASSSVPSSCSSSSNSDTVTSQLLLNNFNNLSQALLLSSLLNQQQQQQQQQSNSNTNDFGGFFYSNLIDSSNLNL
jgi:hypothetical protein